MNDNTSKVQVSQDTLYQYLIDHDVKLARLAELMGVSASLVSACFKHNKGVDGLPRNFTAKALPKLNAALGEFAELLRSHVLTFGSPETFTNQRGNTYDPALVEPMKRVGELMNITAVTTRLLGWSKDRKESVLVSPSSKVYGCISREDVDRINAELLSVAGVLSSYEVAAMESPDKQVDKPIKTKQETPLQELNPWDDTALDLRERFRLFYEAHPDGILFFRVDSAYKAAPDYTVAFDHADLLAKAFREVHPWTDVATGITTAVMEEPTFNRVASMLTANRQHYDVTPMYAQE